jgi:hypothetical protein
VYTGLKVKRKWNLSEGIEVATPIVDIVDPVFKDILEL